LFFVTVQPFTNRALKEKTRVPHYKYNTIDLFPKENYKRIAVALDFSEVDKRILNTAINMGNKDTVFHLIHIVESANAIFLGDMTRDLETNEDKKTLELYASQIRQNGYQVVTEIGFGNPRKKIPPYVKEMKADMLILGSHGHGYIKDLVFGTIINSVRHNVNIPVLIVK